MNLDPFVLCVNITQEEQRRISPCVAQTYLLSILMEMYHYLTTPWPSWNSRYISILVALVMLAGQKFFCFVFGCAGS